jgi:hypothetical protein
MMLLIAAVAVGLVGFIIYALERRTKGEPIQWDVAGKISLLSGLVTSGVVFAVTADVPSSEVVQKVAEATSTMVDTVTASAQDMFVGTPSF